MRKVHKCREMWESDCRPEYRYEWVDGFGWVLFRFSQWLVYECKKCKYCLKKLEPMVIAQNQVTIE